MDERFRGKGIWFAAGALAFIFLCLMLCGMGAMATLFTRQGGAHLPPAAVPGVEEGAVPPQAYYGPGVGPHGGSGPFGFLISGIGMLFRLAFFGLLLLLLLGLVMRLFWGPRHRHPWHWCRPPKGKGWEGKPYPNWGPWARHWHGDHGEAEDEPASEKGAADDPDVAYGGAE